MLLPETSKVLPSGKRIDSLDPLCIRPDKQVPKTQQERLKKYSEKKQAKTIVAPPPKKISISTAKRRSGIPVIPQLLLLCFIAAGIASAGPGGSYKRENKMTLMEVSEMEGILSAREQEEKKIQKEKDKKKEEKLRIEEEKRRRVEAKRLRLEEEKKAKAEEKRRM